MSAISLLLIPQLFMQWSVNNAFSADVYVSLLALVFLADDVKGQGFTLRIASLRITDNLPLSAQAISLKILCRP